MAAVGLVVAALGSTGCRGERSGSGSTTSTAATALIEAADEAPPSDAAASEQRHGTAARAGERVDIPAGTATFGSTPGDRGRDPTLEPVTFELPLGAFAIDKLPYPNDPNKPPATGVSRARAAELCAAAGGRLCHELEWERACRGPEGQAYAGANGWDGACAGHPEQCASGFGALAMGAAMREWTASDVAPIPDFRSRAAAAVRGAPASAADVDHRCAHRAAVDPKSEGPDLGFRCCHGEPPARAIESPRWQPTARKVDFPPERLQQLFASNDKLAPLAADVKYFREESAIDTVRRRTSARGAEGGALPPNSELTTAPILWSPVPGEEILLVTGQAANRQSFVVAFHRLPDDRYRVGSALLLADELGPIVLLYNPLVRRKLEWTTCWGCYGESGAIRYRPDNRVVITQQ